MDLLIIYGLSAYGGHRSRTPATEKGHTIERFNPDIDEAAEDLDHLISPDELLRVAMARQ